MLNIKKLIFRIFLFVIALLLVSFIFPIKFCISSEAKIKRTPYYVVVFDYDTWEWYLLNENGRKCQGPYVLITEGPDPQYLLSTDVYMWSNPNTKFVIYGEASLSDVNGGMTIKSEGWDILGNVQRYKKSCRPDFCKKYLTIYDLKWFDYVLEPLGIYAEHRDYE